MKPTPPPPPTHSEVVEFITRAWARHFWQPLTQSVLVTAVFLAITNVCQLISPTTPWLSLNFLCFGLSLEAIYTTIWLYQPAQRTITRPQYRAAEFLIIALLTRLYIWWIQGRPWPDLDAVRLALRSPGHPFGDPFFLAALTLILLAWLFSIQISLIFSQLSLAPGEVAYYKQAHLSRPQWQDNKPLEINRGQMLARFSQIWLWGGVVLIICTAVSTVEISALTNDFHWRELRRLGLPPQMLLALISYFLAGFWLSSQGRLEVMNARWLINGIQKRMAVERRWQMNSLIILGLMALLAAFLPIGSSLPISRLLNTLIALLLYAATLLFYLFSLLLGLLLSAFSPGTPPNQEQPPPLEQPNLNDLLPPSQTPSPPLDNPVMTLVMSSFFWALLIFVSVSAGLFFLHDRGVRVNGRSLSLIWQALKTWFHLLWGGLRRQVTGLGQTLRRQLHRAPPATPPATSPWHFVRLNGLSPRDQIRYFYLSLLRRAADAGVRRQPHQTPLAYSRQLKATWPEQESELDELTQAFLAAQYSPQPIETGMAQRLKHTWKQVTTHIRRQRPKDI